jgi:hypothetical protein
MLYLRTVLRYPGRSAYWLSQRLETVESAVRKVATFVCDRLPAYYAEEGCHDPIYFEHASRGYELQARRVNLLASLTPDDQQFFNQAAALKEIRTAPKFRAALVILNDLRTRYPLFAPICTSLAEVHGLLAAHCIDPPGHAFVLSERYANQAILLDPTLWTAHAALSIVRVAQYRWKEAKDALQTAERLHKHAYLHYAHIAYIPLKGNSADTSAAWSTRSEASSFDRSLFRLKLTSVSPTCSSGNIPKHSFCCRG